MSVSACCGRSVAYGVEAGLKYSGASEIEARLKNLSEDFAARLRAIEAEPLIPFNTMNDWGENGRIEGSAAAFSPFIRQRGKARARLRRISRDRGGPSNHQALGQGLEALRRSVQGERLAQPGVRDRRLPPALPR